MIHEKQKPAQNMIEGSGSTTDLIEVSLDVERILTDREVPKGYSENSEEARKVFNQVQRMTYMEMILRMKILKGLKKKVQNLIGHTGAVTSAAFSPKGDKIVSASQDKTVCVWDVRTGDLQETLKGHTGTVWSAIFSPEGDKIVSASSDAKVCVWDLKTKKVQKLEGHTSYVTSAAFSPGDGQYIV